MPYGRSAATALVLLALCATALPATAADAPTPVVDATVETPASFDDDAGGSADADDPAVWVAPGDDEAGLVIGTLKDAGLAVYDLAGREVQRILPPPSAEDDAPGRFNNVDLLLDVRVGAGPRRDLAVVTDRGHDTLRFYAIDPDAPGGPLVDVTAPDVPFLFSETQDEVDEQQTAYGLATWTAGRRGQPYAVVSRRHTTTLGLARIVPAGGGLVSYELVRTLDLPGEFTLPDGTSWAPCQDPGEEPQSEGMVVDPVGETLYVAQEDVGIWRLRAQLRGEPRLVDTVQEYGVPAAYDEAAEECVPTGPDPGFGGTHLAADAEGLTIATNGRRGGYLVASSQGDGRFAVYERFGDNAWLAEFRVGDSPQTDAVESSDGAAVVTAPVGRYDGGLLVVHDGEERPDVIGEDGEVRAATDFTYVEWDRVLRATGLPG